MKHAAFFIARPLGFSYALAVLSGLTYLFRLVLRVARQYICPLNIPCSSACTAGARRFSGPTMPVSPVMALSHRLKS
jgi:hypothetical protein